MGRPTRVDVGAHRWRITWLPDADNLGRTFQAELRVNVDPNIPKALQRSTLMHELMHVCWFEAGLCGKQSEEPAVNALAQVLTVAMRRNPKLFDWICG